MGSVPLLFDNGTRGEVAAEDLADAGVCDEGQLDAEADDDAENEEADKEFEETKASHRARGVVEKEDGHDVEDGEGTAGDERQLWNEKVERDGCADDLSPCQGVLRAMGLLTCLGNVRCDNGDFSQRVQDIVQPSR